MDEVEDKVRCPFWIPYGNEHRYDLLYDFKLAQTDIFEWKVHIVRYVNQEITKQDQLKTISTNPNCALVIRGRGTGNRIGLEVFRYDFLEPQYGK